MQGAGSGLCPASQPRLQGPFLEGRNSPKSDFCVVALVWVRSQTKVPSNDNCEKQWNAELKSLMWLGWVWVGWYFGCFC